MKIILMIFATAVIANARICKRMHQNIGCFKRTPEILPDLLINDRDPTHANYSGILIDWNNYTDYLHSLACRCEAKARGHYDYFAIGFYGECFAGRDMTKFNHMLKTALYYSSACVDGRYQPCGPATEEECSGKDNAEYVYKLIEESVKCSFKEGDSIGSRKIYIGQKKSKTECVEACLEEKLEREEINGATMSRGTGTCYCEMNMTGRYKSSLWISCKFGE